MAFNGCQNLRTLNFENFDAGNITHINNAFNYCYNLTTIKGGLNNIGKAYINFNNWWDANFQNLSFRDAPLTRESALNVINGLYNLAQDGIAARSISFSNTTNSFLTEADKQLARDKGWSCS